MEANQVFRFHISRTDGIHQEWPLRIVEPAHVVAGPPAVPADWKVVFLVVLIAGLARRQIVEAVVGKPRIAASHCVAGIEVVLSSETRIRPTPDGTLGPEMLDVVFPPPAPGLPVIVTEAPLGPWHRTLAVPTLEVLNPDEDVLDVAPVRLFATLRLRKPVRLLRGYLSSQLAAPDPVADHRPESRSARLLPAIHTCRTRTEGSHFHEPSRGAGPAARHGAGHLLEFLVEIRSACRNQSEVRTLEI